MLRHSFHEHLVDLLQEADVETTVGGVTYIARIPEHWAAVSEGVWRQIADSFLPDLSTPNRPATLRDIERTGLVVACGGNVWFPAGLIERVRKLLEDGGCRVQTPRMIWAIYEQACQDVLAGDELTTLQREFLAATDRRGASLVIAPGLDRQLDLLQAICLRFPQHNVIAIAPNIVTARRAAAECTRRLTDRIVTYGTRSPWDLDSVLHFDTTAGFVKRNHQAYHVAVWLGDAALPTRTSHDLLKRSKFLIWFGLLQRPLKMLHPVDALEIEAIFGPCLLDVPNQREPFTYVRVAWLPAPAYPAQRFVHALERKRSLFWHNHDRNRQLAQLVRALAAEDPRALQAAGLLSLGYVFRPEYGVVAPTVALIVENSEHGQALRSLLHDWELVNVPEQISDLHAIPQRAVVTLPVAAERWLDADIVVYAAGSGDRWIDGCGPVGWLRWGSSLLIVDVMDDADQIAQAECRARQRDYCGRSWAVESRVPNWLTGPSRVRGPQWRSTLHGLGKSSDGGERSANE